VNVISEEDGIDGGGDAFLRKHPHGRHRERSPTQVAAAEQAWRLQLASVENGSDLEQPTTRVVWRCSKGRRRRHEHGAVVVLRGEGERRHAERTTAARWGTAAARGKSVQRGALELAGPVSVSARDINENEWLIFIVFVVVPLLII
jgi:hypothetical protein